MRKFAIAAIAASPVLALAATHVPQILATGTTWR
jgi:hypothetical protein